MKLIISAMILFSGLAYAQSEDSIYHNYGRLIKTHEAFACEIQNNTSDAVGTVHKIRYEFECVDRYNRLYSQITYFRCGEEYENCTIEPGDFDAFPGPHENDVCHRINRASCYFSYSFPEDSVM